MDTNQSDPPDDPQTLLEAIAFFRDQDVCLAFMRDVRWPDGVVRCPVCGSDHVTFLANARLWKCYTKHPRQKFSAKVGTILEDSPIGLDKWLPSMWLIANCKNGISSYELARDLGVTQKTAWFMLHRLRLATQTGTFTKIDGDVEADETFIGGLSRNMHKDRRKKTIKGTGGSGKAIVMGLLERKGVARKTSRVRARVLGNVKRATVHHEVKSAVEPGARLYTDDLASYRGLDLDYRHEVVDHAVEYVRDDFGRFKALLSAIVGRRLTYRELTGSNEEGLRPLSPAAG